MKKVILAALIAVFTIGFVATPVIEVKAQTVQCTSKTITAADTLTTKFSNMGSNLRAVQYTYTETSGTSAGKVYLEGTINGTWVLLDSLTLADVATAQTKVVTFAKTAGGSYVSYRWRNTNTSSATGSVSACWLRRTDE